MMAADATVGGWMYEEEQLVSDLLNVERDSLRDIAELPARLVLTSLRRLIDEVGSGLPEYTGFQNMVLGHRPDRTVAEQPDLSGETT